MATMNVKAAGRLGGLTRAKNLSAKRRKEIALKAGLANRERLRKLKSRKVKPGTPNGQKP